MTDKNPLVVAVRTELVTTRKVAPPAYPYIFRRAYICGHANEFVQVSKPANQKGLLHTVIGSAQGEGQKREWPTYELVRCRPCAIRLREEHRNMQESGKRERVRSVGAYQGETMLPDRGLLKDARTGFEAALKQLDRISCCGGDEEEDWPLINETVGNDDDSIRVVRFLDGRRKVDSPASSPSPFAHTFGDTWPLRGGGHGEDLDCWPNCGACGGHRRRKDSATEAPQNTMPKSNNTEHTNAETEEQPRYLQDLCLDAPRTPMVVTFGPTSDLDWLRFSYLLRNNNLSFDDIAELVSRYAPDDDTLSQNDLAQPGVTAAGETDVRNSTLRVSVRRSGIVEWDVSTLGKNGHLSTLSDAHSRNTATETSCGADALESNGIDTRHYGPPHPPNPPNPVSTNGMPEQTPSWEDNRDLDQSQDRRSSEDQDISRSCFSSDSSVDSIEFSKPELGILATKMKPTMLSWLRPKRKYDSLNGGTKPETPGPKDHTPRLWKRISKMAPNQTMDATLKERVDRKLHAKLTNTKSRASRTSQITTNDCHPAYRHQTPTLDVQPSISTSSHILHAMKFLNSARTSQSLPRNTTKTQSSRHDSNPNPNPQRPTSTTHSATAMPYGFHRPYRPSPLKHVTRVTSLDVNKGLPALPPEARRLVLQTEQVRLRELQAVRKVQVRRVINEYVGEMAKAY
jgi:hypothetical protein